ncbi:MAG: OmpA family protein [Saprospiraceae bacterium]|nr:OmpA family protein [Saprospiraceae bacterium]
MKNSLFVLLALSTTLSLFAQQQSSKSKSSDKLYEKGQIERNIVLQNAKGVNSESYEFSPAFYQNGIVYVSFHKNGPIDPNTGKPFFELFYAEMDNQHLPQSGRSFSISINSQVHEGPVSFSRDNNLMYFTRNNLEGGIAKSNSKGQVTMKIYEARRGQLDWENIRALPFNNDDYTCFHPSLSADGNRLFFSSDMPGGYGGYDLYYVEKKADGWSKPINLGQAINSAGSEVFPFLHESGTLFYSSNGRGGQGGLDVFMVDINDSDWGEPTNLETPINSALDDLGFILTPDAQRGYFASDRPGGSGGDDIYMFEADGPIIGPGQAAAFSATIVAFDAATNERLPDAGVRLLQQSEDGFIEGDDLYEVALLPSENGELRMKLVRKDASNLGKPSLYTDLNGSANSTIRQGKKYFVLVNKDGYTDGEVQFVAEGKAQTIRVPLRALNCIPLDGMVTDQHSSRMLPNALVRVVNRSTNEEKLVRSNSNGSFEYCLPPGGDFSVSAEKTGYLGASTTISTKNLRSSQDLSVSLQLQPDPNVEETVEMPSIVEEKPIREGSVILLENIYYDFNQYIIRRGAGKELDALAQLMKQYPSMEVELTAHTDSRGNDQYNLELSLKRAESAKRYLIQKGIRGSRILAMGQGETQIRNRCQDEVECSDDEHQYNRRTEVKVVRIDGPVKVEYGEGNPKGGK